MIDRRRLLALGGATAAATLPGSAIAAPTPPAPIRAAERRARREKAQGLMRRQGVAALLVEAGSALVYFAGLQWSRSERLTAMVLPAEGEPVIVTPRFEEATVSERLPEPLEIRTWLEHEDPCRLVAALARGRRGPIAVEETVRHFIVDGLQRNGLQVSAGAAVTRPCRMIKSPAEIALMQAATDITIAAYRRTHAQVREGMRGADIAAIMNAATVELGGQVMFGMALVDQASAYPHGSRQPITVREGSIVLMDCGCAVEGYQSDVSRTFVFGEPSARQRSVWEQVREGQALAFETARIGLAAGRVDDAVRALYARKGWGPGYGLPGLSHRTGHGIGLDGHEPINLVKGETTPLAAGMCFSSEPGLYIPGEFGVRLEDCFHMTEAGPRWFSQPPKSIDAPMG